MAHLPDFPPARPSRVAVLCALLALGAVLVFIGLRGPALRMWLFGLDPIQLGLLASLIAGLFTAVGALPIFFMRRLSPQVEDWLMGFGAGVMLAATAFELVLPAIDRAGAMFASSGVVALVISSGIALGGACLLALHRLIPHEHFITGPVGEAADRRKVKRVWLFVFAIALHNLPEGLAVGVGFAGSELSDALALAIGIGLQNMPEGLIVAVALLSLGYSRAASFGVALLTGFVEPVGGLIGVSVVTLVDALLPWGLAFAAGAMLFVISHEIIPESHRRGHEGKATFGVLLGFVVMVSIDIMLAH